MTSTVQSPEPFQKSTTPRTETLLAADRNQSPRRRGSPRREGSPAYEEILVRPTAMVAHPPPVRVQVAAAGPPTQSSNKLHRHHPNASYPPAPQISTSDRSLRPTGLQTRPSSQSHVGHRGESRSETGSGSHSERRDYDSEPERHHPLATKKSGSSWGVNLFKGMAKSVATSAMNEVTRDTKVIVNSSISNAFAAVGAQANLQG